MKIHAMGAFMHTFYIFVLFVYITEVYVDNDSDKNNKAFMD